MHVVARLFAFDAAIRPFTAARRALRRLARAVRRIPPEADGISVPPVSPEWLVEQEADSLKHERFP